jgi:hypothetical protein
MLTGARIAQRETLAKSNILPLSDTSSLSVVRCVVIGNYAQTGGGLHIEAGQVERCFVQSNTAGFGGGAAVETGELLDSVIIGNTAFEAGGVIIGQAGRVEQCVISGNRAQFGGGVLAGNGLGTESLIRNCRVSDNMATNVGGIVVDEGGIVANCTITGNTASDVGGVGLLNGGRLLNTIVYYNTGTSNGGNWTIEDPTPSFAFTCTDPPPPGTGNITNDPCLTPDFHLKANSPCIDAGTDSNAPPTDIDGEARWDDPRHSNVVSIVDIGADEFVDVDLDSMADSWETNYFGNITNRDGNADADSDDLQDLPEYENGTCPTNRDTDADLMPDGWEVGFVLNPLSNDAGLDQDSDGADNLAEYVADTDPRAPASFLGFFRIGPQAGGTRLDWHGGVQAWQFLECRECVADTNAPWTPILALPPPTPLTNAVIDLGATNRALFYRLRAER